MTDYINREALFALLTEEGRYGYLDGVDIANVPAADVVEVVRCKDCKWFGELGCAIKIVDDTDKPQEMDYCSFGERKEGEG